MLFTITQPILEYANTILTPFISNTSINKLQIIHNTALHIAIGCTKETQTLITYTTKPVVLPITTPLKFHVIQYGTYSKIFTNIKNPSILGMSNKRATKSCATARKGIFNLMLNSHINQFKNFCTKES